MIYDRSGPDLSGVVLERLRTNACMNETWPLKSQTNQPSVQSTSRTACWPRLKGSGTTWAIRPSASTGPQIAASQSENWRQQDWPWRAMAPGERARDRRQRREGHRTVVDIARRSRAHREVGQGREGHEQAQEDVPASPGRAVFRRPDIGEIGVHDAPSIRPILPDPAADAPSSDRVQGLMTFCVRSLFTSSSRASAPSPASRAMVGSSAPPR